jgi:hypothetical protein
MNRILADPMFGAASIHRQVFWLSSLVVLSLAIVALHAQKPATARVESVGGEWRSSEQFEGQPRATLIVREDGALLAGSLTLLGMTRGGDDRATIRLPIREARWTGTTLAFETVLPDNEGKSAWVLRVPAAGEATLQPVGEDGNPIEDAPTWAMTRR